MQKFNNINVESRFIKSLLRNTYVPLIPTVSDGDYLIKDVQYTYKNNIIRCTESGVLLNHLSVLDNIVFVRRTRATGKDGTPLYPGVSPSCGDSSICGKSFICAMGTPVAKFIIETTFNDKKFVPGINSNFISSDDRYDVNTHKYLGKYLRWHRDVNGVDLMPFYNCFSGETTSMVHIHNGKIRDGVDKSHKVLMVPAQLNKKYTVFINSDKIVELHGVFMNKLGRIKYEKSNESKYLDVLLDDYKNAHCPSYSRPFVYTSFTSNPRVLSNRNDFYILIQVSNSYNGSLVVLEGDYTERYEHMVSVEEIEGTKYTKPRITTNPLLTISHSYDTVPYSDRLIEFLTQHVIDNKDNIPYNVLRIQKKMNLLDHPKVSTDVWDDKLRLHLYNNYFKNKNNYYFNSSNPSDEDIFNKGLTGKTSDYIGVYEDGVLVGLKNCKHRTDVSTKYDITGYVDKDIENSLYKYRSVD